jgi:hypothetical protein
MLNECFDFVDILVNYLFIVCLILQTQKKKILNELILFKS